MEYRVLQHWSSLLQHLMYRGSRSLSHQARDDQGLGFRRSGVLPSHARRNGALPIPRMGLPVLGSLLNTQYYGYVLNDRVT